MKSKIFLSIIGFLSFPFMLQAITLPPSLSNKPIYHVYAPQLNGFSCGYNALFNICKLENNQYSNLTNFSALINDYLAKYNQRHPVKNTVSSSTDAMLYGIARRRMKLDNVYCLNFNENNELRVAFCKPLNVTVTCAAGTPRDVVKEMLRQKSLQKARQRTRRCINILKKRFETMSQGKLHFVCRVFETAWHWVLVSLVKTPQGAKTIYIADNLNRPYSDQSGIVRYIKFICNAFNI
jgi:hypothetical protein